MDTRFTQEDIDVLVPLPTAVAMLVMAADSGKAVEAIKEMVGMVKGVSSGITDFPNNQVIKMVHGPHELGRPGGSERAYQSQGRRQKN